MVLEPRTLIFWGTVGLFTLLAFIWDWRNRRIPNWLTVPALVLALMFHIGFDGWAGLKWSAGGFALGFGMLLVLWLMGSGGAGDVKLMGALGAWLGFRLTLYVIIISTGIIAVGSVIFLVIEFYLRGWSAARRRYLGSFSENTASRGTDREAAIRKWRERRRIMPYAFPVGIATWLILTLDTWLASPR